MHYILSISLTHTTHFEQTHIPKDQSAHEKHMSNVAIHQFLNDLKIVQEVGCTAATVRVCGSR